MTDKLQSRKKFLPDFSDAFAVVAFSITWAILKFYGFPLFQSLVSILQKNIK